MPWAFGAPIDTRKDISWKQLQEALKEKSKDAKRYAWLADQFSKGQETYIGEWIDSKERLDSYIDEKMAPHKAEQKDTET